MKLIAEIGSCNGDLSLALDTVDAFAEVGVWGIKGQLFRASTLTTRDAATYGLAVTEPDTQWEAFETALTYDQWGEVQRRCGDVGVEFFGSVFDLEAVDVAREQMWDWIKLASGDITHQRLYEKVAEGTWHVFWSTGASEQWEIERAAAWLGDTPNTPMACTLAYPCPVEHAHVNRVTTLQRVLDTEWVGYSDHTMGIAAAHLAFTLGAEFVEKHVTIRPGTGGDHDFGATPATVKELLHGPVNYADSTSLVAGSPVLTKRWIEQAAWRGARRSLVTTKPIRRGEPITDENTVALRPGFGLPPVHRPSRVAIRDLERDHVIKDSDVTVTQRLPVM